MYSIIIHNSPKLETTQTFINCRIDKSIVACSHNGILSSSGKEQSTTITTTTTTTITYNYMRESHQHNNRQNKSCAKEYSITFI